MEWLLIPWQHEFMRSALLASILVAIPAALLSCLLVLRGWALMGDAIAHAVLPGVVLSYLLKLPYVIGAFAAAMSCAMVIGYLKEHSRVRHDTLMGVVFSGMFALGLVLHVAIVSEVHLLHILFGDLLGISSADLWLSGGIAVLVMTLMLWRWRDLLLHAFDPIHAASLGLPVRSLHYGLLALLSLAVVGALKAVGLILAIALLIAPGAIAFLLVRRFAHMLLLAALIALFSCVVGVYLSFFIDSAVAPSIVLVLSVLFVIAFLIQQCNVQQNKHPPV